MLTSLNAEQRAIVQHPQIQNLKIVAGPGAGKTRVLIFRILYMMSRFDCDPKDFLVATFTNNAARELERRFKEFLGECPINCGTFHAIAKKWLNLKDGVYHVDEYQYLFYQALQTRQYPVKYIFVDEYQDINEIQFKILQTLYPQAEMIAVVGDDNQNIYEFRGSDIKYIQHFTDHFPNVKQFYLSINYRSTPSIVALANAIQKQCTSLEKPEIKSYFSLNPTRESNLHETQLSLPKNRKPRLCHHYNIYRALEWLLVDVKKALGCGMKPETIAILSCNNYLLNFAECRLQSLGIGTLYLSGDHFQRDLKPNKIVLSTIHGSKGLEWQRVYVLGLHNQHFPDERHTNLEPMRRLLYVAVTRAKSELILFNSSLTPSIFITDLSPKLFHCIGEFPPALPFVPVIDSVKRLGVSTLLRRLSGADYQYLKQEFLPEYTEMVTKLAAPVKPRFIRKIREHRLYAEFGIFIEFLAKRMLFAQHPYLRYDLDEAVQYCIYQPAYKTRLYGDTRKAMQLAYKDYYDVKLPWQECLTSIWCLSWAPSLVSGKQRVSQLIITHEDLAEGMEIYSNMEKRLEWKPKVTYHESLSFRKENTELIGEVDFLVGNQIIDMKCEWDPQIMNAFMDFIQVLIYAALARKLGKTIESVAIYNPIYNRFVVWPLETWTKEKEFITYLLSKTSL